MISCPACTMLMKETYVKNIHLDVCLEGCGGIWFDQHELSHFDEKHEDDEGMFLSLEPSHKEDHDILKGKRTCPRCEETVVMLRHYASFKKEIEIDECGLCGGIFLDGAELSMIRNQFETAEEKEYAVKNYIEKMFLYMKENSHYF